MRAANVLHHYFRCSFYQTSVAASSRPPFLMSTRALHSRGKPVIILDLDDTLLLRTSGLFDTLRLYMLPRAIVGAAASMAIPTIQTLSPHFDFAAVTARWSVSARNTNAWLDANGLTGLPCTHSWRPHPFDASRVQFKSEAIDRIRVEGARPVIGVGDRPSDLEAYLRSGLQALMVRHCLIDASSSDSCTTCSLALDSLESRLQALAGASVCKERRGNMTPAPDALFFTNCIAVHERCSQPDGPNVCRHIFKPAVSPTLPSCWSQIGTFLESEAAKFR